MLPLAIPNCVLTTLLALCAIFILANARKILSAVYVSAPVVNLTNLDAAKELLDKRGAIYSDRPRMVFTNEMYENIPILSPNRQFNTSFPGLN